MSQDKTRAQFEQEFTDFLKANKSSIQEPPISLTGLSLGPGALDAQEYLITHAEQLAESNNEKKIENNIAHLYEIVTKARRDILNIKHSTIEQALECSVKEDFVNTLATIYAGKVPHIVLSSLDPRLKNVDDSSKQRAVERYESMNSKIAEGKQFDVILAESLKEQKEVSSSSPPSPPSASSRRERVISGIKGLGHKVQAKGESTKQAFFQGSKSQPQTANKDEVAKRKRISDLKIEDIKNNLDEINASELSHKLYACHVIVLQIDKADPGNRMHNFNEFIDLLYTIKKHPKFKNNEKLIEAVDMYKKEYDAAVLAEATAKAQKS